MSLVLPGATSGSITVDVPAVAGTNTLTLPALTGTVALTGAAVTSAQLPAGTVLQVVNTTTSIAQVSTASTSYVTTGISLSITPKFATSKIYVVFTTNTYISASIGRFSIYRNATDLDSSGGGICTASGTAMYGNSVISITDSPATTSSTAYTLYFKVDSGGFYAGITNTINTITLMEIAA